MAALDAEFVARYSTQRVRTLTRADDQDSSTYNAAVLGYAVVDATAEFKTAVGVVLDTAEPQHVRAAVLLVEAILLEYGAGSNKEIEAARKKADAAVLALRKVTSRDRATPTTSSPFTPSERQAGSLPDFDIRRFDQMTPAPPGGGSYLNPDVPQDA